MEYYDSAVSNAYMCVEACLRALLLSKGIRRLPKTHGGILRLFIQEFIATNILPRDLARNIGKLLEMRGRADYEALLADADQARFAIEMAQRMLEETINYLSSYVHPKRDE